MLHTASILHSRLRQTEAGRTKVTLGGPGPPPIGWAVRGWRRSAASPTLLLTIRVELRDVAVQQRVDVEVVPEAVALVAEEAFARPLRDARLYRRHPVRAIARLLRRPARVAEGLVGDPAP